MNRSRLALLWLAAGLLCCCVLVLGGLQYYWLKALNQAQAENLRAALDTGSARAVAALNQEVTALVFSLQNGAGETDFDEKVKLARSRSRVPRWIRSFWRAERRRGEVEWRVFDEQARAFRVSSPPEEIAASKAVQSWSTITVPMFPALLGDVPAVSTPDLRIPLPKLDPSKGIGAMPRIIKFNQEANNASYVAVLDRRVVREELIPRLLNDSFGPALASRLRVAVFDGTGGVVYGLPEDAARLRQQSDWSGRCFDMDPTTGPRNPAGASDALMVGWSAPVQRSGAWLMRVSYGPESLAVFTRRASLINRSVLGGLLLLLVASLGLLVIAARRSGSLARQQMDFVAAVSHELRTPLAAICAASHNIASGVVDDRTRVREYASRIHTHGRRLTGMVNQVLEFARLEAVPRSEANAITDVASAVEDVLRELEDSTRGLTVDRAIATDLPPVGMEEADLRNCLRNLVENACKYGRAGAFVGIRAERTGEGVELSVSDRGSGIAPSELPRVFEPFYRAPANGSIQGLGLGLALVKRTMDAWGYRMSVSSQPGRGSRFCLHLPAREIPG